MSKDGIVTVQGVVIEVLPGTKFVVELYKPNGEKMGHTVRTTICGKIRKNSIRILKGDKVRVELSPYDLNNGRICWRY